MTIVEATKKYEQWLAGQMPLVKEDLKFKHEQMASASFPFFRASYYRWAQKWEKVCKEAAEGPEVLAVGDLHVENFGTWRDLEGRLIWGVNDFDEATPLPYTNDLIRLAASAAIAIREEKVAFDLPEACESILEGYAKCLEVKGRPFVLEAHHKELREMATGSLRAPGRFWEKMEALPEASGVTCDEAMAVIGNRLPGDCCTEAPRSRRAGLGSLGRPRFVLIAEFEGGKIAREAKHIAASAALWAKKAEPPYPFLYPRILEEAVRCNDPLVHIEGNWLVRRLAPHCTRIAYEDWPLERDEIVLLEAMGFETGNIHLGPKVKAGVLADDLKSRPKKWLRKAAERMADFVEEEAGEFRGNC